MKGKPAKSLRLTAVEKGLSVRQFLSAASALTALLIWSLPATARIELPESCHMGECSVGTLESKELLRSNELGDLYLANFSGVSYPAKDADDSFRQRFVDYYGSERVEGSSQSYIFCSSSMPSTLFVTDEREYILNRLVLTGNPPANYIRNSHIEYLATCHNIAGPDFFSADVANMLIRGGYNFGQSGFTTDEQMRVSNILEIMNPSATGY